LTFREYGDAMFAPEMAGPSSVSKKAGAETELILLVDSVLRREQLLHKLQDMGLTAQTTTSAEAAMSLARSPGRARAIICDNLEPSNHLVQLGRLKNGQKGHPALVLITAGSASSATELQWAHDLGADGVWTEPFNTPPLAGIGTLLVEKS